MSIPAPKVLVGWSKWVWSLLVYAERSAPWGFGVEKLGASVRLGCAVGPCTAPSKCSRAGAQPWDHQPWLKVWVRSEPLALLAGLFCCWCLSLRVRAGCPHSSDQVDQQPGQGWPWGMLRHGELPMLSPTCSVLGVWPC